ncbi:hypothetical protein ACHWQZ_G001731 [Mnemiopsis leidyi]
MVDILMIKADDPKVLSQYHKQKLEFHFQQKSDNDFVRFLLDTAARVISIVQHLAPVIEAVSTAETDQIVSNQYISDFNIDTAVDMEVESPKQTNCITQSNSQDETSTLDVESIANTSIPPSATPAFNISSLGSALKSFAPPTSAFQTALSTATSVQALAGANNSMAANQTPHITLSASLDSVSVSSSPGTTAFSSPAQKTESIQLDSTSSLLEFDKTIAALQNELDSVSQSLVSEADKGATPPPAIFNANNLNNLNNLAIIKRLQENFKDSSEVGSQSGKELDLIKTIQETIASRTKADDVIKIKEEMEVLPTMSLFSDSHNRQTTDRLQQLMSSLNNSSAHSTPTSAAPVYTPPTLLPVSSSTALNQISSLAPSSTSALSQLASGVSPGPSISPGLKSSQKKNGNPLSMLHLQGNGVDQAAILSVLYNDRKPTQASPDMKMKSAARTSPNSSPNAATATPGGRRRPFHCVHCLKNFSFKSSLDRHISVIHLGLRRYSCPICAAAFGQKKQLKHHMSTRHSDVIAQLQMIQTS